MTSDDLAGKKDLIQATALRLLNYCRVNEWAGYDPYDALNSRIFAKLRFLDSRIPRLVLTQALKRSPLSFRAILGVPKTQNPKAIGLFLSALLKLSGTGLADEDGSIRFLIDRLIALRSPGVSYWCWGYSFPWQMRTEVVPVGSPNLVCTTFVANALLDAFEQNKDSRCFEMALSAAKYILNELYWKEGDAVHSFSYPLPSMRSQVHNANFLAAALLCRAARVTADKSYLGPALDVVRCSVRKQEEDGSWKYGEGTSQRWIDNFHTGFNLGALQAIGSFLQTDEFEDSVRRGFEYYRTHFFRADGAPKYFHNRTYPIDIHCVAQGIITLTEFRHLHPASLPLALRVFQWSRDKMWDDHGFFYYRVLRSMTIRTSYMRWSQAWMCLALATLLVAEQSCSVESVGRTPPVLAAVPPDN